ncbi:hypothetical protein RJ641_009338 [Dillenia turbinata]|uniref:Uncharacterized protein n=1 Tax=Dillenia turbinata TaxID=194707 RepID=A0AAN8V940_9MAGN
MAEAEAEAEAEAVTVTSETVMETSETPSQDMDVETLETNMPNADSKDSKKRLREEEEEEGSEEGNDVVSKVEKSAEEERLEKSGNGEKREAEEEVVLGPKKFGSSKEMFYYFYNFLHHWPPNVDINKYEHLVLLDLLKKGHLDSDKKIGSGVNVFQVQFHPTFKNRCFFIIQEDGTVDDFSFRKCVDNILPLPDMMQPDSYANKALAGKGKSVGNRGGRGGKRGGHGRGGGRKSRN